MSPQQRFRLEPCDAATCARCGERVSTSAYWLLVMVPAVLAAMAGVLLLDANRPSLFPSAHHAAQPAMEPRNGFVGAELDTVLVMTLLGLGVAIGNLAFIVSSRHARLTRAAAWAPAARAKLDDSLAAARSQFNPIPARRRGGESTVERCDPRHGLSSRK